MDDGLRVSGQSGALLISSIGQTSDIFDYEAKSPQARTRLGLQQ
jgi:hypothetical protein